MPQFQFRSTLLHKVFLQRLEAIARPFQSVEVLAERKSGVAFSDTAMLFAIELSPIVSTAVPVMMRIFTSLTGMLETPISNAMNQQALKITLERPITYLVCLVLEITPSALHTLRERIIFGELDVGYILKRKGLVSGSGDIFRESLASKTK